MSQDRTRATAILDDVSTRPVSIVRQVLLVDDTPANLISVEAALESTGCNTVKASSGEEALACLLRQDFALVLLDVNMPGMDGFETARWIRSRQRSAHVPIIFITAFVHDDQALLRAYELGAVDFLFKPIYPEVLRAKVQFFVELLDHQEQVIEMRLDREYEAKRRAYEAEALAREVEANRELARLNAVLEARDRAKDQFIEALANELRHPLAPIRSIVDELKSGSDATVAPKRLSIMDRQMQIVGGLIDDLIELSHLGTAEIEVGFAPRDLRTVVEDAIAKARPTLDAKSCELVVKLSAEPVPIRGDHDRLVQAVANLLTNATQFAPEAGRISIACISNDRTALVIVEHNGIGIPPARLPEVFTSPKAHDTDSSVASHGIGLALAQRLVSRHNGRLTVSSGGPNLGSTFVIQLPMIVSTSTHS